MKYMVRWAQTQHQAPPPAYDWAFVLEECAKLAIISYTAWLALWSLFPAL